jgi:hypothetical protein
MHNEQNNRVGGRFGLTTWMFASLRVTRLDLAAVACGWSFGPFGGLGCGANCDQY